MFPHSTKDIVSDFNIPFERTIDIPETLNFSADPEELVYDFFWEAYFQKSKAVKTPVSTLKQTE